MNKRGWFHGSRRIDTLKDGEKRETIEAALVFDNSRIGNGLLDSPRGRYKERIRFSLVLDSQYSSPRHPQQ
jgi:hypothetical protein